MFRSAMQLISFFWLLLFSTPTTAQIDAAPLVRGEGYLLVAISSPRLFFDTLSLEGRTSYQFEGRDFDDEINFRIIKLPAGEYYWSRMVLSGTRSYFKFKKNEYPLTVKAGRVNYGGMFLAEAVGSQRGAIQIVNRVTSAIEFVEECCAEMLQKYPLRFAAAGNDSFVDYYSALHPPKQDSPDQETTYELGDSDQVTAALALDYFRRSKYEQPKISPNGRYVLMFETNDNLRDLILFDPANSKKLSIMAELRGDVNSSRRIHGASWVDDLHLVFTYRWARTERMALGQIVFDNDIPTRVKVSTLGRDWRLLDPLPGVANRALVVHDDDDSYTLYDLDVTDPKKAANARTDSRLQKKFKATSSWLIDATGRIRAAIEYDHNKQEKVLWYRTQKGKSWQVAWRGRPDVQLVPILASDDNRTLTVISNEHTEHSVLTTYNQRTKGYGEILYALDGRDIEGAFVDPLRTRVVAVTSVEDGVVRHHYLDSAQAKYSKVLEEGEFGNDAYVIQRSLDERFAIIRTSTSDNPGALFWLDSETGESVKIGDIKPWLSKFRFGTSQTISTTTPDGLTLESFLTLPDAESYPRPPLIVMPHGGPIRVRDTRHFDSTVQLLSALGYAVLQTNYRGSGGQGKSFLEKGYGQWGRNIENDINAAMLSALDLDVVDAGNICIFGASYGGYSALISAILRPEKLKCAASFAGVTDMTLLFHDFRVNQSNLIRASMQRIVGDPKGDLESLVQYSPAFHADAIEIPIFLAHGVKDRTVDIEHFDRMRKVLRHFGKDAEFVILENEGHGFAYLNSTVKFYALLDRFFRRAMALPAPSAEQVLRDGEDWPEIYATSP